MDRALTAPPSSHISHTSHKLRLSSATNQKHTNTRWGHDHDHVIQYLIYLDVHIMHTCYSLIDFTNALI